jgi:hypothetical protein
MARGGERADGVDDEEREMSAQTEQWSASLKALTESQMASSQVGELMRSLCNPSPPSNTASKAGGTASRR